MILKDISGQTSIKLIYYFFKIFGLATVSLKVDAAADCTFSLEEMKYINSYLHAGLLIFSVVILSAFSICELWNSKEIYTGGSERVIDLIMFVLVIIETVGILIFYSCRKNKIAELAEKVNDFRKFSRIAKNKTKPLKNISLTCTYATNLFILVFFVSMHFDRYIIVGIASYLSSSIVLSVVAQYTIALKLLKLFFEEVNEKLTLINEVDSNNEYSLQTVDEISNIRRFYASLEETSQNLSDFFSKPVFLCITYIFRCLTLGGYYIFRPIMIRSKSSLPLKMRISCFGYEAILYFLLIMLTQSVEDVKSEV